MKNTSFLNKIRRSKYAKAFMAFVGINMLSQVIFPTAAMALTSGAASPEFASFEPVATTNMVNDFTGDFTYNLPVLSIPGPDGGGYSMSLSYHSGASPEEEASWVGFGWTLNPGAINRNKRGYADDFNGVDVIKYNKVNPNWTSSSGANLNIEFDSKDKGEDAQAASKEKQSESEGKVLAGFEFNNLEFAKAIKSLTKNDFSDLEDDFSVSLSLSNSIRYNNYTGFSVQKGFGASTMGIASLNMNRSGGENTFGISITPISFLSRRLRKRARSLNEKASSMDLTTKCSIYAAAGAMLAAQDKITKANGLSKFPLAYSSWSFNAPAVPYSVAKNAGVAYNVSFSFGINPIGPLGLEGGVQGSINTQANYPKQTKQVFGYMHNPNVSQYESVYNANNPLNNRSINPDEPSFYTKDIEADYQIEKATTFNKHDNHLGIPFNNADVFSATGNGVMGGFQVHQSKIGHFYPTFLENEQQINQAGVEGAFGGTIQVGLDVGVGFQKTRTMDWRKVDDKVESITSSVDGEVVKNDLEFSSSSNSFMRFNGDMGGELSYTDDELLHATVGGTKLNAKLNLDNFYQNTSYNDNKEKQTSYIEYATYNSTGGLENVLDANVGYRLTNVPILHPEEVTQKSTNYKDLIGQIAVTDKSGNKSTYGLPVFTKEETQLTVGISDNDVSYVTHKNLEFDEPLKNKTVSGSRITKPYANTYLLTNTTTFDYVDADDIVGPSEGDFGGWTKFNYRLAHFDYRFRAPYTGLFYNRGRLTHSDDETGSMSSGIKEVNYLESIETKTHVAYFVTNNTAGTNFDLPDDQSQYTNQVQELLTGSPTVRPDGLSAAGINSNGIDEAALADDKKGPHHLEKLEKIVLYAKNDYSRPISVTYFEYDQSLCHGIPNADNSGSDGKLTLKKVWTEGGGIAKTRIAPYQFEYQYFREYSNTILQKYPNITDVYAGIIPSDENPNYEQGLLDMWGNYRINAAERFKNMQPWLDQNVTSGTEKNDQRYDPAAWQLKRIKLPSGGEIHIQYEQKDYLYVQDHKAMIMIPLQEDNLTQNTYISKEGHTDQNLYCIDLEKIGISNASDAEAYAEILEKTYINEHKKLYFKMLYNLKQGNAVLGNNSSNVITDCDYITGYTSVNTVNYDDVTNKIYLSLGNKEIKKDKTLPRFLAYRQLLLNGGMNLTNKLAVQNRAYAQDDELLEAAYNTTAELQDSDYKGKTRSIGIINTFDYFANMLTFSKNGKNKVCKDYAPSLSYFKLPTYHSKKGGGVRVKRLLSYDPGIDAGDEMVYGSEYIYKLSEFSNLSSGVATNEPSLGREENALVEFLERKPQKWLNKVTKGRDSKQFEGPIGESLLPGASIGYSRVIVKNIHSGKTTTGYAVNEYHTAKDFPMIADNSEISKDEDTYKKFNMSLPLGMVNFNVNKAWATQGYLFKINDMHGKPKSQSTYAGNYDEEHPEQHLQVAYTARTVYNYSKLGNSIKSLVYDPTSNAFNVGTMRPGYEEDLTLYRSRVKDRTNDFSLELDLNLTLPAAVTVGFGLSYAYTENQFSQHVTSKVLRQKTYLLSTTSTVDGVTQTTENLAFNKHTGDPVLTRTYDGYKGAAETINTNIDAGQHNAHYYALNIPGSWIYEDLAHKSENEAHSNQLTANVGSIVTYGDKPFSNLTNQNFIDLFFGDADDDITNPEFDNVVSASAVVLKKGWFSANNNDEVANEYDIVTADLNELNQHYYPLRSYLFRDPTGVNHSEDFTNQNNPNHKRIYGGGTAKTTLEMFPWLRNSTNLDEFTNQSDQEVNAYWFSASKVNKYSPHGIPLEEEDVLNINSTAHFGYNKTLPTLVAQNASYKEVAFKDYENDANAIVGEAHSGNRALAITNTLTQNVIENYNLSTDLQARGLTMKLWLKSKQTNNGLKNPTPNLKATMGNNVFNFNRIAQTGEWSLYEARILSNQLTTMTAGVYNIGLLYNYAPGTQEEVYIDDVRIQPLDAVMNCTVYTKDNRVTAQFDDQHFGVFYEYNREGQLVRKSIETERGRKTVQEQQYNVPSN